VVIDEFHHAHAPTYRRLLDHLTPRAARPHRNSERADGVDVRAEFFDGRTATELRLWDALGKDLLCPLHYFAVADGTDLRRISCRVCPSTDAFLPGPSDDRRIALISSA